MLACYYKKLVPYLTFIYTCRALRHPNIITLMGASLDLVNLKVLLITNFVDGNNLETLIFKDDKYDKVCLYVQ